MDSTVCAIVPVYNEAQVLDRVLRDLIPHVDEVIVVDDGSSDDSVRIARDAGATVLRHAVNLGQGGALQTGFDHVLRATTHAHAITFDSDGQHDVQDALRMLEVARAERLDVVLGTRIRSATAPAARRFLLRGALWFSRRTTGLDLTDTHNGLRVLGRHALGRIRITQPGMAHASEIEAQIARLGLTWAEVPVTITYDAYSTAKGQSNLNAVNILFDLAMSKLGAAA